MQTISIIGNLTKDPEIRTTPNGVQVCSFTVAVDRKRKDSNGEKVTDFFRVNVWRVLGETCQKYLSKGRKVYVSGELQARLYQSNGKTFMSLDIQADEVEFLSPKADQKQDDWTDLNPNDLPF